MKSYREIADSVFARRDQYVIQQRKKKQAITRVTASVGSVALVSLAGFALLRSDVFRTTPPITDGVTTTTTAVQLPDTDSTTTTPTTSASSVAQDVDTTASDTDAGKTQSPEKTTVPSNTQSPPTTAPNQTEPSKTTVSVTPPTTTPTQKKLLLTATEPDYESFDEEICSLYRVYISSRLRRWMKMFEGEDVEYAVIVSIPPLNEDYNDSKVCNEEMREALQERQRVYNLFKEEAKLLNPTWSGVLTDDIEIWTDDMRENYEWYCSLRDKYNSLVEQYSGPYIQSLLNRRFEVLKGMRDTPPVDVACYELEAAGFTWHAYYAVLTAEEINDLAERGGYTFCLAMLNQKDYGSWDIDE